MSTDTPRTPSRSTDSVRDLFPGDPGIIALVETVMATSESVALMDVDIHHTAMDQGGPTVSVNVTGVPLRIDTKDEGTILLLENISSEKRVRSTMARYMDPALADRLVRGGEDILGGTSATASVLFTDIRVFTTITEQLGPQATVSMLNEYFTLMVGDGVNLAARLESACKQYDAQILISDSTHRQLNGVYRTREVDRVVVKGKIEPVAVHEVLDDHTDETFPHLMDVVNDFRDGIISYRRGAWDTAIASFRRCLDAHPADALSATYVDRCEQLRADPPDIWDGSSS